MEKGDIMSKRTKTIIIAIVAIIVFEGVMIGSSIFKCENMTKQYGSEFAEEYKQAGTLDTIDYYKVLGYSPTKARVYYVSKAKESNEMIFEKKDNKWVMTSCKKIWAADGSARGFEFPYFII